MDELFPHERDFLPLLFVSYDIYIYMYFRILFEITIEWKETSKFIKVVTVRFDRSKQTRTRREVGERESIIVSGIYREWKRR